MPRHLRPLGAGALALLLAGCTGPATTPASPPTRGPVSIDVEGVGAVRMRAADAGPPAISDGGVVVLPTAARRGESWDTVTLVDPVHGTSRVVARSAWSTGLVNWVAAAGGWVVYTDQSAKQSPDAPEVLWRVEAVELSSGHRRTLATSGDRRSPFVPVVGAQDGVVFWTQAEEDESAEELVWTPGAGAPYALLRHAEMTPGSATVSEGAMFYLGPNGRGTTEHTTGGDCWRVPLTGGEPVAATHTALAMWCAARAGHLVWSQHIDPATPNPPADGIYDDPYSLWTLDPGVAGSRPRKVEEGYSATYGLHPTDHALVWQRQSEQVMVSALADPTTQQALPCRVDRLATGAGDLLARVRRAGGQLAVAVDRVVVREGGD